MKLRTDAIDEYGFFDPRYTCDMDNSSPGLRWESAPPQATSFVIIAEDPDAPRGMFTHWVVYEIPGSVRHLPPGIPPQDTLPNGIRQGVNSFGKLGYGGPCPPHGDLPHHYRFRIHALLDHPELPPRATREQLLALIQPFVIETGDVIGRYQRAVRRAG